MGVGAEAEIWLSPPILQVMTGLETGSRKVRNFVAIDTGAFEALHRDFVEVGDIVFTGHGAGAVSRSEHQQLAAQIAIVIDLEHVHGYMRRADPLDPIEGFIPALAGLKWQSRDEVEIDVRDTYVPQYRQVVDCRLRRVLASGAG